MYNPNAQNSAYINSQIKHKYINKPSCVNPITYSYSKVSTTAANGGADCSSSDGDVDTETCNNQPCPEDCVGAFDDWTGTLSSLCEEGTV